MCPMWKRIFNATSLSEENKKIKEEYFVVKKVTHLPGILFTVKIEKFGFTV